MSLPVKATIGEIYGGAMKVTTKEEAKEYFEKLIARGVMANPYITVEEVIEQERANVCYYAGYFDLIERNRVLNLFFKSDKHE